MPVSGDLTSLNHEHLILNSVGRETLAQVAEDYLELLGTSVAIYEKNGDYALVATGGAWCTLLQQASRRLAKEAKPDRTVTDACLLCHRSCWGQCAQKALQSGQAVEITCAGGLQRYARPIMAGNEVVGAIAFAHGSPPQDSDRLAQIARQYHLEPAQLGEAAQKQPRPSPGQIARAKRRLATAAQLIGAIVAAQKTEEALKRSEARLIEAQALARVGNWELDLRTNELSWSEETQKIFGVEAGGSGSDYEAFLQAVHPEDRALVDRAYSESVRDHTLYDLVHRLRLPGGEIKVVHERCVTHYDQQGRPLRSLGAVQDITERKRAEDALKESEERYRLLFEGSLVMASVYDRDGVCRMMNQQVAKWFGGAPRDFIGKSILQLHPDEGREYEANIRQVIDTGQPMELEGLIDFPRDSRWLLTVIQPLRNARGEVCEAQIISQDITERKQAEEELSRNEDTLRGIFDTVQAGIILVDQEGRITFANQHMSRLLGRPPGEIVGSKYLEHTHSGQSPDAGEKMFQLIRGEVEQVSHERLYERADGSTFWGHLSGQRLHHADGSFRALVGVIQDITQRKNAEDELRQVLDRLTSHLENSPMGVVEFDPDFRVLYWSPQAERIFGWSSSEAVGKNAAQLHLIYEEDAEGVYDIWKDMIAGRTRRCVNLNRNHHKNGRTIICQWYNSALLDDSGGLVSVFSGVLDVTESQEGKQALMASEERYRQLFRAMFTGFALHEIILDDQGRPHDYRFLEVNPAFEELTGLKAADLLGRTVRQVMPGTERQWIDTYGQVALTGQPVRFESYSQALERHFAVAAYCPAPGKFATIFQDITEQRRYEQELKEREALLNEVGEIAKIGGWEMDLITRKAKWTKATYDIVGIDPGQKPPGPDDHLVYYLPEYQPGIEKMMLALENHDQPMDFEAQFTTAKGEVKWCRALGRAERVDGKAVRLYGTFQDITERKKAEEALRESELWLQNIFDTQEDAIFVVSPERKTIKANASTLAMFGYSERELYGHSTEILHVDRKHYERFGQRLKQAFDLDAPAHFEFECKRKNGEIFPTEHTVSLIKADDGQLIGILSVVRDITERKRAAEELAQREEEYRTLVNNIPNYIVRYDKNLRHTFVNPAWENASGLARSQVVSLPMEDAPDAPHPAPPKYLAALRRTLETATPQTVDFSWVNAQGAEIFLEYTVAPEFDRQGQVCGVLSIGRDLTESKRAEEQTKLLEAQLRQAQKLEAMGTLAGGIAHDFNNILAAIMGYAELTQDDLPPGHPSQDSVEQILKGTRRARDLVRQILNFSRPGEEHQHPVQLALLVREALKLLRPSIPSSIEIRQNIPEEEVFVLADQSQMHQVLMNLCTNAAQAMGEKGLLEVGLETVVVDGDSPSRPAGLGPGPYQVLWVGDDGPGMDAKTMARVFDPFFTTKQPGAGTGMGLSVVHGIVQAHGGAVTVESRAGEGTTFRVYIPTIEKRPETSGAAKGPMSPGGESILLVDDEEALLDIGRQVLERLGYRVTTQSSSQAALELFRRDPQAFDLVITDYTMPHLTGTSLAQEMLALRPELPIILCTGYSSDHITGRRALDQGIRSLAQKPLRTAEIALLIRQVLDEDSRER